MRFLVVYKWNNCRCCAQILRIQQIQQRIQQRDYGKYLDIRDGVSKEEILSFKPLVTNKMGRSIFVIVKKFCKSILLANIILACATDRAILMIGRHLGFIAHLKWAVPTEL